MHSSFLGASIFSLLAAATAVSPASPPADYGPQDLSWSQCSDLGIGTTLLQCTTLEVPLDHNDFSKGNITLGIVKHPATNQSSKIGSLFYNPGGPGVITSSQVGEIFAANALHPEISESFDFIGVDLRGTGLSSPVNCSSALYSNISGPTYFTDDVSFNATRDANLAFRQSCLDFSGNDLIEYMDTTSIATDHEYVRRAIGNETITFLGQSYGTQLALRYAELFPDSFRAILLDANNDVAQYNAALLTESAAGNEAALKYWFSWCQKQNATICPAAYTNQTLEQTWLSLLDKFEAALGPYGPDEARTAAYHWLYTPATQWPLFAQAFYEAAFQDNTTLWESPPSQTTSLYNLTTNWAEVIISCSDHTTDTTAIQMKLQQHVMSAQFPLMNGIGTTLAFMVGCIGWPYPSRNPPHEVNIPRTNKDLKILMVSTLYDPATATIWTQTLQEQIGQDRTTILMRDFGGHTTYFKADAFEGPTVAAMNKFLLTLETPVSGTVLNN